eukprot:CAMPEP_0197347944 /NCGR_PEP_ID=MMETSP0893-20130614/7894_1 /TAXON_ID=44058 ORGANISM="Aureoumbra lagunensis, Strain CCMP1510" /NCGR_SAMPLE_ID=MMETSP0893 /ASSEMBLY_ACC=CAM_ASM_000539 /LENGTH=289 /DNA_ID=CAMNT_0042858135 /DNA_START=146 /DNA_END=1012 /DNA_ORIENTATION=+
MSTSGKRSFENGSETKEVGAAGGANPPARKTIKISCEGQWGFEDIPEVNIENVSETNALAYRIQQKIQAAPIVGDVINVGVPLEILQKPTYENAKSLLTIRLENVPEGAEHVAAAHFQNLTSRRALAMLIRRDFDKKEFHQHCGNRGGEYKLYHFRTRTIYLIYGHESFTSEFCIPIGLTIFGPDSPRELYLASIDPSALGTNSKSPTLGYLALPPTVQRHAVVEAIQRHTAHVLRQGNFNPFSTAISMRRRQARVGHGSTLRQTVPLYTLYVVGCYNCYDLSPFSHSQ